MATNRAPPRSRGEETRRALIEAALEVFGRDGFHAASTRAIARRAGTNQALIGYHFGDKEGLYLAVFEHITARMGEQMGPLADAIERDLAAGPDEALAASARRERYLPLLHRVTDNTVAMLARRETAAWARLILREQQDPSAAFDILYSGVMGRLLDLLALLVSRSRGSSPDDPDAQLTALTIMGQALVFRIARATVLRRMGWDDLDEGHVAAIQERIRANVTAMVRAEPPAPEVEP